MEFIAVMVAIILLLVIINSKSSTRKTPALRTSDRQLDLVAKNEFKKRKLMNKEEYVLYKSLEKSLKASRADLLLFPQVSLGEIISSENKSAYFCINSKRADFVSISRFGDPLAVVEYQGGAHYQGNAIVRDAVKKEACRKAGIAYMEITPGYSHDDLAVLINRLPA